MAAPANDNIANAQILTSGTQVTGNLFDATRESGESSYTSLPSGTAISNKTVWYRWYAGSATSSQIDLIGSTFDTILSLYIPLGVAVPTAYTQLQVVAGDDDAGGGAGVSKIVFTPVAGQEYWVQVSAFGSGGTGAYTLNYPTPSPRPWLNIGSGLAARNGTTSHTVSFGFTSTSGSLLLFLAYGAVTHAATGWTVVESPTSSGQLAMLTKTSAGDSSITLLHNGSNYPVGWTVYELPAGSTITTSDNAGDSADTFPTITLPGTAQVVIAARGRVAGGSETGASTTWTSPLVEDSDVFTAASGTDGLTLAVGHQIGVTATTYTPAAATTYSGTWGAGDRQRVAVAIELPSGGSGTTANAGAAAVSADAQGPAAQTAATVPAGQAAVAADGQNATAVTATSVTANAGIAGVAADGFTATTAYTVTAVAGVADVAIDGHGATVATTVTVSAGQAAVAVDAHNPNAVTVPFVTADAGFASVGADGYGPVASGSATVGAGQSAVSADAYGPAIVTAGLPGAGAAAVAVDAYSPVAEVAYAAQAGLAAVAADAHNPAPITAANAFTDVALVDVTAVNPTVSTSSSVTVNADVALVGVDAYGAGQAVVASIGQADVGADAYNATAVTVSSGTANAGAALVAADAANPAAQPAFTAGAGHAAVAADAFSASAVTVPDVVAPAGVADVAVTAAPATANPVLSVTAGAAEVGADALNVAVSTEASTVVDALTAIAAADAFAALQQVVAIAGTALVGADAYSSPKQRRPGILTAGTRRSLLVAGVIRGPTYTTGG